MIFLAYAFSLQKVLDYRIKAEEEQQRNLAKAFHDVESARREQERLTSYMDKVQDEYSTRQSEQMDVPKVLLSCDYVAYLANCVKEQEKMVALCEQQLAEQLRLTEKAMQDRKTMDVLREKDFLKHRHELNLAEQRFNDEMARFAFLRK
ncbi:MAG: flagellar export protein FliJ [Clostridiales bacterium]|nr:flagellar export protein FliJ [Clostridiales bacterium]